MNKLELVGRLVDNTYNPSSKTGTYSINTSMQGNKLIIKFLTVVYFASESALTPQVQTAKEQATSLVKSFVSDLKKKYKESADDILKVKEIRNDDNIEIIQSTSNSPRKIAYYRFNQVAEIL